MAGRLEKKALAREIDLFFVDETTLGLHPVLNRCWMKRGQQKRVPTPGQPQWQHLVGAYNYVTDEVIALPVAKKTSDGFIAFLDHFLQQHTNQRPVVWILDNASIHHSLASQAAFSLCEEQLMPLFLPAYCSDLNPIERFWRTSSPTPVPTSSFLLWTPSWLPLTPVSNVRMTYPTRYVTQFVKTFALLLSR